MWIRGTSACASSSRVMVEVLWSLWSESNVEIVEPEEGAYPYVNLLAGTSACTSSSRESAISSTAPPALRCTPHPDASSRWGLPSSPDGLCLEHCSAPPPAQGPEASRGGPVRPEAGLSVPRGACREFQRPSVACLMLPSLKRAVCEGCSPLRCVLKGRRKGGRAY